MFDNKNIHDQKCENLWVFIKNKNGLLKKVSPIFKYLLSTFLVVFATASYAATPVVNTTISLEKTGSEPFDTSGSWTGDGPGGIPGGINAGQDASEDDNIVRLQDSITYRVEVSVNDSDVEELTTTVTLNEKQKWITIPTGCKTDPLDVGAQGVSEIRNNDTVLFCNLGPAIEGTTRVVFPAARAVGVDPLTGEVSRNDDIVTAGVSAQGFSSENGISNIDSDGPTEVVVTGFFRVDLQKELKSTATDPDTGAPLYDAPTKVGPSPANRAGSIIEYTVLAKYVKGSLLADGDLDTTGGGSPGVASYRIVDVLTDNNIHNDTLTHSTGAQLYTWDPLIPACELLGDPDAHGASATVNCSQLVAAIDDIGPGATTPDGLTDLVVQIDLANIDVSDPDSDGNLFEVRLNIWFDKANDIDNHQICQPITVGGTGQGQPTCTNTTTNRVGFWDGTSTILDSFDELNDNDPTDNNPGIVSTEDATGNNVPNYNAGEEPFPNEVSYSLSTSTPGSYSAHKSFTNLFRFASAKEPDQNMAAGETRPFLMNVYDYRKIDQAVTQFCDKIDTQVFEYVGVAPPNQIASPALYPWNQDQPWNPVMSTWGGANSVILSDGTGLAEFFFTNHPYTNDPITNQAAYLEEMRTATCDDDINGNGVVIQQADGSLVDENGDTTSGVVDWWVNADDVPPLGGGAGSAANITRLRQDTRYDAARANAQDPTHVNYAVVVNHLIKAKLIASSPYGTNNRLPNFASYNRQIADGSFEGWDHVSTGTVDPAADANFSIQAGTVDRMTLVPSSHSIAKYTDPSGIKVVRGGDTVDFIIQPEVFGIWTDTLVNTATVEDDLPNGTDYVANSEMFSSTAGITWYTRDEWDARFLAGLEEVSISSAAHAGGVDPLQWDFASLNSSGGISDQLPLIKYSVYVDPSRVSGTFTNTTTINSGTIGGAEKEAKYQLTILPEFGLDVLKTVDKAVYQTNTPFSFDLIYKNLGGEDYAGAEFIDILPYNGDAAPGVSTGGVNSNRDPQSRFNGVYDITAISRNNGELFFATVADPTTIEEDPCHASNLPAGYDPDVDGGVCNRYFDREGMLPGGGNVGTNTAGWVACTGLSPLSCGTLDNSDITAIKFTAPLLPAAAGGQTVTIELTPSGNLGGTPDLDAEGNVTAASTGDVYTNTFGGRISEISLNVISNDVSVTMVSGSIGNYLWIDTDGGADQDLGEPPIANVTVKLLDGSGNPVLVDPVTGLVVPAGSAGGIPYTVETNASGLYSFDNLPAGDYQVEVDTTDPDFPNVAQTFDNDGLGTPNLSALTLSTTSDPVTGELTDVVNNDEQDFGYRPLASLGNFVWDDLDGNGQQDSGEPGIDGVTVTLLDASGNPLKDISGNDITTTTTNGGMYSFTGLEPGPYSVKFTNFPTGYIATVVNQGNDVSDSDASGANVPTAPVLLAPGDNNTTLDLGLVKTASLGDTVWSDDNGNGIKDSGESGVGGVTVYLLNASGVRIPGVTAVTNNAGFYEFTDLTPGTYSVEFDLSTLPTGYEVSPMDQGSSEANDSDANTSTGITAPVTLAPGENNPNLDMGVYQKVTLGSTVFADSNNNGLQDGNEIGIEGVTLQLFNAGDDPTTATPVNTIVTDANGDYLFDDLVPGSYFVYIPTPPLGAPASSTDIGSSTADNQVDGDDNGQQTASGEPVQSPDITLVAGNEPVDGTGTNSEKDAGVNTTGKLQDNSMDANGDMTIDFGFVPASIGDTIWHDVDFSGGTGPNAGDIPLANVTVTLTPPSDVDLGAGDGVAITTTTDVNGNYLFELLPPGEYTVTVDTTSGDLGANSDLGIFIDPDSAKDSVSMVTLESGEQNLDQDFAYAEVGGISGNVSEDTDGDGIGDLAIQGVTLQLLDGDGNPVIEDGEPVTTVTDENGNYAFTSLIPDDYQVAQVQPGGFVSVSDVDGDDQNNMIGDATPIAVTAGNIVPQQNFVERRGSPTDIPTLSEWALIVLMMMLGLIGHRQAVSRKFKGKAF